MSDDWEESECEEFDFGGTVQRVTQVTMMLSNRSSLFLNDYDIFHHN